MKRALTGFIGLMLLAACESQSPASSRETQHTENIKWEIVAASDYAVYLPLRSQ